MVLDPDERKLLLDTHDSTLRSEGKLKALADDVRTHELILRGREGKNGLVGDVRDLKRDKAERRSTLFYIIVPLASAVIGAVGAAFAGRFI